MVLAVSCCTASERHESRVSAFGERDVQVLVNGEPNVQQSSLAWTCCIWRAAVLLACWSAT
eukprot:scaffold87861_cov21-Tisochrysis_lutea.AAC.1